MQVSVENFEGPIDLLVYLVQKNEMSIENIKISIVTEQYLQIIQDLDSERIENAADFMAMAATLIYIKSKSLLPQEEITSEDQMLVNEIKDDLIRKIQEFQTYKILGRKIEELPWSGRDFFTRPVPDPEVIKELAWAPIDLSSLVSSYQKSLMESRRTMTLVKREYKSISQRVSEVKEILEQDPNTEFSSLLSADPSVQEIVITFISLLELARLKFLSLDQPDPQGPIKIMVVRNLNDLDMTHLTGFEKPTDQAKTDDTKKTTLEIVKDESHEQTA